LSGSCRSFGVRARPRAAFGICSAIESDATTHRTPNSESFRESSTFVRRSRGACAPGKHAAPKAFGAATHCFAGDPPSRARPPFGPTLPVASLPLQSLAGDPPSPSFGVASTPATTDSSIHLGLGTREVCSRVPAQSCSSCSYGRGGGVGYGLGVGLGLGGTVGVDVGVAVGVCVAVAVAVGVAVGVCVAVAVAVGVAVGV
jgi:hypothetical protein